MRWLGADDEVSVQRALSVVLLPSWQAGDLADCQCTSGKHETYDLREKGALMARLFTHLRDY